MMQMVKAIFVLLALTLAGGFLFYVLLDHIILIFFLFTFFLAGGLIFYILLDLKPWRKDSQLWLWLKSKKK